ncbi:MAG: hypothetical protein R3C18_03880 [Planctomycetaceae bacterium]
MSKLQNGTRVGDFTTYVNEVEKRGFGRSQIQFTIGLIAIAWGRAQFDGMDFEFSDQLEIRVAGATHRELLAELEAYAAVSRQSAALLKNWLGVIVRTYSTEYAEIMPQLRKGIVGEIELANPVIQIDLP